MNQINIQFPDGNTKEFDKGTTTEAVSYTHLTLPTKA